ncbi:helix-turn-helix domain-containing protein [Nocardia gipuzkoensis]
MLDALAKLREIAESNTAPAEATRASGDSFTPAPNTLRQWLTENEAVELVGRSPWTVRDWRLSGLLPCRSGYGVRMYRRDDLIAVRDAQAENYRRGVKRPRRPRVAACVGQLALAV